jgi:hypothetical protein
VAKKNKSFRKASPLKHKDTKSHKGSIICGISFLSTFVS